MDIYKSTTRPVLGLTGKGRAAVVLIGIRDRWDSLTPSQQQECSELLERLSVALRREHSVMTRQPARVPLVARITA